MRKRKKSVLLFLVLVLILSGCGTKSDVVTITNVSYDPTREFYESYNTMFEEYYKKTYNKKVQVIQSHGGSGSQARSVVEGCNADVVTLALEHDISLIEKTGLVDAGWIKEFPKSSAPYTSTIVLLVRKGNPKQIHDWDDLTRKGVDVITPDPKSSGGACWNFLAALGYAKTKWSDENKQKEFMRRLYHNVSVMDSGARGATTTFVENGKGDVLIAWENEAIVTMKSYAGKYEIVNPSVSILAQPSVAIVDDNAKANGSEEVSKRYLDFLYTKQAQRLIGKSGYRPTDKEILQEFGNEFDLSIRLWTIDDFGGWEKAYQKYFDELMNTHDLRMKYTEEFLAKGTKVSSADEALGIKAVDYIALAPKVDANQAYQWLSQSVNAVKGESAAATLFYFLQMSLDKLKADPNHKEQFIQDYLLASEYADAAIAAETNEAKKKNFMGIKDNLVALFVNSGTADCESLQSIYGPKVEANQTDLAYLKKVIDIMKMMRCTESEAYLQASFYAYKIEPTAEAATGCAYQAFKKGDIDGAVKFFDEAIQLETDNVKKAEKAYAAAAVLASAKKLSQARSYCQKAISFNENYGAPYILIANLYAMSPNWSDESALNKCTYFAVIDKLQKAKSVDPSVTEEVNKMISRYSAYTPQAKDLFMLGYKAGDRITIGGWIGESTTIG